MVESPYMSTGIYTDFSCNAETEVVQEFYCFIALK
jgi:hypothetical protein